LPNDHCHPRTVRRNRSEELNNRALHRPGNRTYAQRFPTLRREDLNEDSHIAGFSVVMNGADWDHVANALATDGAIAG
jgi:hypothetical protein